MIGGVEAERKKWIWFAVLLVVATALRVVRLDMGFWMDELITVMQFVPKPWLKIITEVPFPNNHILYTLLCKLCFSIFGEHEWSARLPAFVFGSLTPPIFYLILRKRFPETVAFCAGLFLAVNFWMVWFSQDARGYSAFILFGILSTWTGLEYLERGGKKFGFIYIALATVCAWFYLYAVFLVGAQALWGIFQVGRKKALPSHLLAVLFAAILGLAIYLPGLPGLYHYAAGADQMSRLHHVDLAFFKETLMMLCGSRKAVIVAAMGIMALLGIFFVAEKWTGFFAIKLGAALLLLSFTLAADFFIYPRFLTGLMPLFAVSVSSIILLPSWILLAWNARVSKALSYFTGAVIILMLLPGLFTYYSVGKQGFREAAAYLEGLGRPEAVVCYGFICPELKYYYPGAMTEVSVKEKLSPDFIKGKLVISRRVDWTAANLQLASEHCDTLRVWKSAGYKENILVLLTCR